MIDRDHVARARHILNEEIGIAWDMLAHMLDNKPRPKIVEVARRRTNNDPNGFALIEGSLGVSAKIPQG